MKIYCAKQSDGIQSGSIVEFIQPDPDNRFRVGVQYKVTGTKGKFAWVYNPTLKRDYKVDRSRLVNIPQPDKDPLAPFAGLSGKFIDAQKDVVSRYNIDVDPNSPCWSRMHAHVKERRVCKYRPKNSAQATFDLFHEIGHIETTKSNMRRCESEYYATVWAIQRCKEYGIPLPMKTIQDYQEYIDDELDRGLRRGGSGYGGDLDLYKYL